MINMFVCVYICINTAEHNMAEHLKVEYIHI